MWQQFCTVCVYFVSALKTFGDIFVAEQLPLSSAPSLVLGANLE